MRPRPSTTSSTRSTATSPDAGPGAGLQDRRAQDQGAARARDAGARRQVRHPRLPRRRARQRRGAARRARSQRRRLAEAGGSAARRPRGSRPAVSAIRRRRSVTVRVGGVTVGGDAPVVVQSMTNTDTADVEATALPGQRARAGRLGARAHHGQHRRGGRRGAARSSSGSRAHGVAVPLVGDFHFNGHKLLREHPACARGARQVPHQPGQRRPRQQARPAVRRDDRDRLPATTSRCASASTGAASTRSC